MTKKEIKYLILAGISDKTKWTKEEQEGYISSLTNEEKNELDSYDHKAINKSHNDVRNGMRCPQCGEIKLSEVSQCPI
jgi:hypothetical protein